MSSVSNVVKIATAVGKAAAAVPMPPKPLRYGTAGFRDEAVVLASTMLRCGVIAAMRSLSTGETTGIMITASHNPAKDNGVKLVDNNGGMLHPDWEGFATEFANTPIGDVATFVEQSFKTLNIDASSTPRVVVGRDTRPSSDELHAQVLAGLEACGAEVTDVGVVSTPIVHHVVRCLHLSLPEAATVDGYWNQLGTAFRALTEGADLSDRGTAHVDCADGVGGAIFPRLVDAVGGAVDFAGVNLDGPALNDGCGAEFVQKQCKVPRGFGLDYAGKRCVSVDGDADRVVYFSVHADGSLQLFDGDKIAALAGAFVGEQLSTVFPGEDGPQIGVVQTAYANGASTAYLHAVAKVPIGIAKTGVKFVHHAAERYDVGIYFEANGHGTVLIQPRVVDMLKAKLASGDLSAEQALAARRVLACEQLVNQAVGDAFSDALFVEAVLAIKGWTLADWGNMYTDLPSRQTKVRVADRTVIETNETETMALRPVGLQDALTAAMGAVASGRAFVRPSGTEDVVRIYAEAETQKDADALARRAAELVFEHCDGQGEIPSF